LKDASDSIESIEKWDGVARLSVISIRCFGAPRERGDSDFARTLRGGFDIYPVRTLRLVCHTGTIHGASFKISCPFHRHLREVHQMLCTVLTHSHCSS